jgi:type I restriction enzyme S subunit
MVGTEAGWLPQLPVHWRVMRAKHVFREVDCRSVDGAETHLSMHQKLGLVPSASTGEKRLVSESYAGGKLVEPDDLVLNRLKAHLGVFAHAAQPGVISPDYTVLRSLPNAAVRYYEYLLKSPACRSELRTRVKGIVEGFWRLYTDDFYDIRLPVPPLDEQRLIIRFLDWHGAMTGKLIRAKRRLIALLNEQKQSIIHRAVTRGLDPAARLKPSGVEWLGDVPEHWEVKRLKWIARNISEQASRCDDDDTYVALEDVESWSGKLLRIGPAHVEGVILRRFERDDVLFGKLRPYLAKVVRPDHKGVCVGELLVLRTDRELVHPSFLEVRLRASDFITHVNSSTFGAKMPRADWGFIGGTAIAYPPSLPEQHQIVGAIASEARSIDDAMEDVGTEIALIQEFRTRLIADVVTGQLDVRAVATSLPEVSEADAAADLADDDDLDEDADELASDFADEEAA